MLSLDYCEKAPAVLLDGRVHFWFLLENFWFHNRKTAIPEGASEYVIFNEDDSYDGPFSLKDVKLVLWTTTRNSKAIRVYYHKGLYREESRNDLELELNKFFPNHKFVVEDDRLFYSLFQDKHNGNN